MEKKQINPDYRCDKCGCPLIFESNYVLNEEEAEQDYQRRIKGKSWIVKLFTDHERFKIDHKRKYYTCSNSTCNEEYLIDLREGNNNGNKNAK